MDGSLVWNWENKEVFGNNLPNENLSANLFKFNLRFPGQYWDEEKGSSYNYHRDYASGLGRYLQSDPIGLNGGTNTYGYVGGNSLTGIDFDGLLKRDQNGNLIYTKIGGLEKRTISSYDPGAVMMKVLLYTDKNNPVIAYKRVGSNPIGLDYTADCHGVTFADSQYWINNNQVQIIINDEYQLISEKDIRVNDVVIYVENNYVAHSLTLVNSNGMLLAYGKGGNEPSSYLQEIKNGWTQPNTKKYYYRKK